MTPKRAFLVIVGLIGLSVVVGAVVYYWADQNLSRRALDISRLKADLDVIELKTANAQQAQIDLQNLEEVKKIAAEVLPPTKVQSNVVGEISSFANNSGVVLESINFVSSENANPELTQTEPIKGVPGVNALPLTVSVKGSYSQIIGFLRLIERNQRKMQVDAINLNPTDDGTIGATITINVYVKVG